jgi:ribonuclease HI
MEANVDMNLVTRSGWAGYLVNPKKPGYVQIYAAGQTEDEQDGPGGYCALLVAPSGAMCHITGSERATTEMRMKLMAVIAGLEELQECDPGKFCVVSDSDDLVEMMERIGELERSGWKARDEHATGVGLRQRLNMLRKRHEIDWLWKGDVFDRNEFGDRTYIEAAQNLASSALRAVSKDCRAKRQNEEN